jgi:hypothetical protein
LHVLVKKDRQTADLVAVIITLEDTNKIEAGNLIFCLSK